MLKCHNCPWCDKTFRTRNLLLDHIRSGPCYKKHDTCPYCSVSFPFSPRKLKYHIVYNRCHKDPEICCHCQKEFVDKRGREIHEQWTCTKGRMVELFNMIEDTGDHLFTIDQAKFLDAMSVNM